MFLRKERKRRVDKQLKYRRLNRKKIEFSLLPIRRRETKSEKSEVVKEKKQREKLSKNYPGGDSAVEPPETIPNSEVKRCNADGSVGFPHVRVGHRRVIK